MFGDDIFGTSIVHGIYRKPKYSPITVNLTLVMLVCANLKSTRHL